jgi:hypothetical protein
VGSQSSAQNNILTNVSGTNLASVIHISSNSNGAQGNCPSSRKLDKGMKFNLRLPVLQSPVGAMNNS